MATESKKKSRRSRRKSEEEEGATGATPEIRVVPTPLPDELRKEISDAISDLIFAAQQVVAMAVQVQCDKRDNCVLVEACRDLSKKVYAFLEVQRKISKARQ